ETLSTNSTRNCGGCGLPVLRRRCHIRRVRPVEPRSEQRTGRVNRSIVVRSVVGRSYGFETRTEEIRGAVKGSQGNAAEGDTAQFHAPEGNLTRDAIELIQPVRLGDAIKLVQPSRFGCQVKHQ